MQTVDDVRAYQARIGRATKRKLVTIQVNLYLDAATIKGGRCGTNFVMAIMFRRRSFWISDCASTSSVASGHLLNKPDDLARFQRL